MMRAPVLAAIAALLVLPGCKTVTSWFGPSAPKQKPAELVSFQPKANARVLWQGSVGAAQRHAFFPAVAGNTVYVAGASGQIAAFNAATGAQIARFEAGTPISGGVGFGAGLVLVGTARGEVLAFEPSGKPAWRAQLTGEVLSPPAAAEGVVVVRTGDGRIHGLNAVDGKPRWVYQRALPSLSVRSFSGVTVDRGGVFAGFPGGRLVAIALSNGNVGWESVVALPRGATELERVTDVAGLPAVDGGQVCAVAFQGRAACFDAQRGDTLWARDASSIAGLGIDARNLYYTDDRSAVVALERRSGSSLWKQDRLDGRWASAPLAIGRYVVVGDFQGQVHVLSRDDGSFVARVATDGSAIQSPPVAVDFSSFIVQTRNGGVFAINVQ
ncbi:MAG: outer membrane protein assembly factor BamB [Betaproteobacteria bacterium]|nr:outer membrane protein assembly factor BamB [Betaproteobacteria bacterium]